MQNTINGLTHCVVCRRRLTENHKCSKRTIAGILAAQRRVENWYDPEHPSLPPDALYPSMHFSRRETRT